MNLYNNIMLISGYLAKMITPFIGTHLCYQEWRLIKTLWTARMEDYTISLMEMMASATVLRLVRLWLCVESSRHDGIKVPLLVNLVLSFWSFFLFVNFWIGSVAFISPHALQPYVVLYATEYVLLYYRCRT